MPFADPREGAKPREVTQAGDRSILDLILKTIMRAQDQERPLDMIWIDKADAHLLAKELYDRRLTGMVESRAAIEAKIKDGRLTLFNGTPIGVTQD